VIPEAERTGDVPANHRLIMEKADALFMVTGIRHNCHTMCALFVERYPQFQGTVKTGRYLSIYDHSWIELPGGAILDIYPVGGVRPLMVTSKIFREPPFHQAVLTPEMVYQEKHAHVS
jgi:hypothetical protein